MEEIPATPSAKPEYCEIADDRLPLELDADEIIAWLYIYLVMTMNKN